jgi:hypothetical protein
MAKRKKIEHILKVVVEPTKPVLSSEDAEKEDLKQKEELYRAERQMLVEAGDKNIEQHDKAMLTLSAGALALSLTFVEKIAPHPIPATQFLLGIAWLFFILSLIVILASFQTSHKAYCRQREIIDEQHCPTPGKECDSRNNWAYWTEGLNICSYSCFILGVIFLASFSWSNLPGAGNERQESRPEQKVGDGGNHPASTAPYNKEKR